MTARTINYSKVDLSDLILRGNADPFIALNARLAEERSYSDVTGYHIYVRLRFKVAISSAEDDKDSRRYLDAMESVVNVAEGCSGICGAKLLEVQAKMLHFVIPANVVDENNLTEVIEFCTALAKQLDERVIPQDPDAWRSYAMALDHSRAIILKITHEESSSLVSLGVAANRPAKRVELTEAGFLDLNQNVYRRDNTSQPPKWHPVDLRIERPATNRRFFERMDEIINARELRQRVGTIALSTPEEYRSALALNTAGAAVRIRGFVVRIDLDGFTKDVEQAFNADTEDAIRLLVKEFWDAIGAAQNYRVLQDGKGVSLIQMPWAGDQATFVANSKNGLSYNDARNQMPFHLALDWHFMEEQSTRGKRKWAVSVAGGGVEEGADGVVLIATVGSTSRPFRICAGWGAGRSSDAHAEEGFRGTDTILHEEDWSVLESALKDAFSGENTFRKATLGKMKQAIERKTDAIAKTSVIVTPRGNSVPSPRPYGYL